MRKTQKASGKPTSKRQTRFVDGDFYYRCLIPCALPHWQPVLKPEELGTLHAVVSAYTTEQPIRVTLYRQAEKILNAWHAKRRKQRLAREAAARKAEKRQAKHPKTTLPRGGNIHALFPEQWAVI